MTIDDDDDDDDDDFRQTSWCSMQVVRMIAPFDSAAIEIVML